MKNKLLLLCVGFFAILFIGMQKSYVDDSVNIFNSQTKNLVETKNSYYNKTKAKPHIYLISLDSDDKIKDLKPAKKDIIIACAHTKKNRNNVQILVGEKQEKVLSQTQTSNIIRYAGEKLRSSNSKKFNQGIRMTFNACATLIDQKYSFPGDKNTLTQEEMQKVNHPQSVNLVWGIVIAVIATGAFTWYQHWKIKN